MSLIVFILSFSILFKKYKKKAMRTRSKVTEDSSDEAASEKRTPLFIRIPAMPPASAVLSSDDVGRLSLITSN